MRLQMLKPLYDQAAAGLPVLGAPADEARRLQQTMRSDAAADLLIRRAVVLSGATGFACGLPGYLAMPITVPSNVGGVLLIQLHLCASIAALNAGDPHDPAVREQTIQIILNDANHDEIEASDTETAPSDQEREHDEAGGKTSDDEVMGLLGRVTSKLGERGVRFVGEQAIQWAYRARHGSRSLPFLGGAIGAVTDSMDTQSVGKQARRVFLAGLPVERR